jgi:hypothetical protein
MPTIVSSPPLVSLAGNPVYFGVSTGNHVESEGIKSRFIPYFRSTGQAGNFFTLHWSGHSVTFTCSPTPDVASNDIPDRSIEPALEDWVALLAPIIAQNYFLAQDFELSVNTNELILEAKNPGQEFSTVLMCA